MRFDPLILSYEDAQTARNLMPHTNRLLEPDVVLAPDGDPYLYRWHLIYDNAAANVFFHIQVKSDPERPFHDHPWDNQSVILSGGYDELYHPYPPQAWRQWKVKGEQVLTCRLRAGDTHQRMASWAHRLILPDDIPYTMTLFSTGPKVREWGFWYPDGWHHNKRHVDDRMVDGRGVSIGAH